MEKQEKPTIATLKRLLDGAACEAGRAMFNRSGFQAPRPTSIQTLAANDPAYVVPVPLPVQFQPASVPKTAQKRAEVIQFLAFRAKTAARVRPAGNPRRYWGTLGLGGLSAGVKMRTSPQ